MGERTDQIEQQINRTREDLGENFNELEQKVKSAFDWRTQFEERPMTMLAIAFGGGVIASALLPLGLAVADATPKIGENIADPSRPRMNVSQSKHPLTPPMVNKGTARKAWTLSKVP